MNALLKTTLIILLFTAAFIPLKAQEGINLVPNPSFEEYLDCPEGFPDLDDKCKDWMTFRGTPDYFHNCSSSTGWNTWLGYKESHSGEAHAGFCTYQTTLPNTANEHIGVQLLSPLVIGEKYYVSFFVSTAYEPTSLNVATNKIGALFTTYSYYQDDPFNPDFPLPTNNAHVYTNDIIADTINWVKISGSFVADSAYQYLIIGNFFEDSHLDTLNFPNIWGSFTSYYYLDDVCVTTDSLLNETWQGVVSVKEEISNTKIGSYPNPTHNSINIKSDVPIRSVELYNYLGQSVLSINNLNEQLLTIPVNQFTAGYYILKVKALHQTQFIKIVIN